MRRVLALGLLAALAVGLLPAAPVSVVGQSATITLSFDDGAGTPSAVTGVDEEDGAQTVRVVATASAATSAAVTVNVTIAAGTATVTTDYATSVSSTTVTIANGATAGQSAGLTVTPVSDMSVEGDETIVFSATTSATGYAAISNANLLIFDDDDDITLSFDDGAGTPSAVTGVSEEGGAQTVRVVATPAQTVNSVRSVAVTIADGTAATTTDYTISGTSTTVSIAANAATGTSAALQVTPVNDTIVEGDETIAFTGTLSNYDIKGADLLITDDDDELTLTVSPTEVLEHADPQPVTVTVGFPQTVAADTDVTVEIRGGAGADGATAGASGDFTTDQTDDNLTITISGGQSSGTGTFNLTALADSVDESAAPEKVDLTGKATVGATESSAMAELSIYDRVITLGFTDAAATPAVVTGLGEDDGAQTVRVTAEVPVPAPANISLSVAVGAPGGTAAAGSDYTTTAPSTTAVTILAGETSASSGDLSFTPLPDRVTEDHETIKFTGTGPAGYTVTEADLRITDADRTLVVSMENPIYLEANSLTQIWRGVTASLGDASSVLSTSSTYSGAIRARVVTQRGTASLGLGGDYAHQRLFSFNQAWWTHINISAGALSGNSSFETFIVANSAAEPPETFYVRLTDMPAGFRMQQATATIVDRLDTTVRLTLSGDVTEGGNGSGVNVTASFPSGVTGSAIATDTVVTLEPLTGGTAGPDDFSYTSPNPAATLTIPMGGTSSPGSGAFSLSGLTLAADNVVEGPETILLKGAYTLGGESRETEGTVTILDDADADIELSASPETVVESGNAQKVTVTAQFKGTSSALTSDTTVTVTVASGDGTGAATLGASGDFTTDAASDQVTVVIPAGALRGSASFNLTAATDSDNTEGFETGKLTGSAAIRGQTLTVDETTVTIADPGRAIALAVDTDTGTSGAQTSVGEADGTATVQVSATLPSGVTAPAGGTVVGVNVVGGGAALSADASFEAGEDFSVTYPSGQTNLPSGHNLAIPIAAGASTGNATFTLVLNDDNVAESAETVVIQGGDLTISSTAYKLTSAEFEITDSADDTAPTAIDITLLTGGGTNLEQVGEADGTATVRVRVALAGGKVLPRSVTVPLRVGGASGDTAVAGDDYENASLSVTIPPYSEAGTADFALRLTDDDDVEGTERLSVHGGTLGAALTALGFTAVHADALRITDSERIQMTASALRPQEGSASTVTVGFTTGSAIPPTNTLTQGTAVTITTAGAAGSTDFTTPNSAVIAAGAIQTTFRVTIRDDSTRESDETIILTATTADHGTDSVTLTIPANDQSQPTGGGGNQPPPTGGGGSPPPTGGGGGGGGGGGAPPPVTPPPPPPAEPACQGRFCDDDGSVHQANIERIAGWEITLGCDAEDATKYCPSAQITRRQMAAFLYRAVSQRWTIEAPEGVEITDVPADAWYRTFADWVVSIGAFATTNGLFNPGGVVTRADMAVMMIAAFPHLESVEEPEGLFNDAEDLDPAIMRAIEGMYSRGVTRGCTTDPLNYCPAKPVTRSQMASFFVRAIDLVPATGE